MKQHNHAQHTSSTAHYDDQVQYLVVGDESSLAQVQSTLALLPLCARGRVFLEVAEPQDVFEITVPMRMTVTWLPRSIRAGRPGTATACMPGEAVTRAVNAWSAEMLCDGPGNTHAVLTGNYRGVVEIYDTLVGAAAMSPDAVEVPEAFKLHSAR